MWSYITLNIIVFLLLFIALSINLMGKIVNDFKKYYKCLHDREKILSKENAKLDMMNEKLDNLQKELKERRNQINMLKDENERKLSVIRQELIYFMNENLKKESDNLSKNFTGEVSPTVINKICKMIQKKIEANNVK